jgi:hypothetical protein
MGKRVIFGRIKEQRFVIQLRKAEEKNTKQDLKSTITTKVLTAAHPQQ